MFFISENDEVSVKSFLKNIHIENTSFNIRIFQELCVNENRINYYVYIKVILYFGFIQPEILFLSNYLIRD